MPEVISVIDEETNEEVLFELSDVIEFKWQDEMRLYAFFRSQCPGVQHECRPEALVFRFFPFREHEYDRFVDIEDENEFDAVTEEIIRILSAGDALED